MRWALINQLGSSCGSSDAPPHRTRRPRAVGKHNVDVCRFALPKPSPLKRNRYSATDSSGFDEPSRPHPCLLPGPCTSIRDDTIQWSVSTDSATASWRASFVGDQTSSSSRSAITDPLAASMPSCLLRAGPPPSRFLNMTIRSSAGTDVCTSGPATTMISSTEWVWSRTDCTACMRDGRPIVAITALTLGLIIERLVTQTAGAESVWPRTTTRCTRRSGIMLYCHGPYNRSQIPCSATVRPSAAQRPSLVKFQNTPIQAIRSDTGRSTEITPPSTQAPKEDRMRRGVVGRRNPPVSPQRGTRG